MPAPFGTWDPMGATRDRRVRDDLPAINHWLSLTRLRAVSAVILFAFTLRLLGVAQVDVGPLAAVCGGLALFSVWSLRLSGARNWPWPFFYLQQLADLIGITAGIAMAVAPESALLFRPIFILVVVPASLVSVPAGLVCATGAGLAHTGLLVAERGLSTATLLSLDSLAPTFLFFLVAQQCFFYAEHLEEKNRTLARLAGHLDDSKRQLEELVDVARALNSTIEPSELLALVSRLVAARLEADWAATFLVDREKATFRLASDPGALANGFRGVELPIGGWKPIARLERDREIVLMGPELEGIPEVLTDRRRFSRLLLAGLFQGAQLLGFLAMGYVSPSTRDRERDLRRLRDIAEHATIALRNAQLLEEAREASALKSEFVSTMSHELRTPLNVLIGYAEVLRDGDAGPLSEPQRELIERMDARSRELHELIEATLQVGRLEAGCIRVELAPVAPEQLLAALQAGTAGLPHRPEVPCEWTMDCDAEGAISTDLAKVALIVRNLVSNAFKFTESGRVEVTIRPVRSQLEIQVADTGVGMAPEQVRLAFEMFRQLDANGRERQGGVGLGLYIVDQLVKRLGGRIEVESAPNRGSIFRVLLPGYSREGVADAPYRAA
jgi:signal transduction histidine kinase